MMEKKELFSLLLATFLIICFFSTVSGYQMRDEAFQAVSADYTKYLIDSHGDVPEYNQKGEVMQIGIGEKISDKDAMTKWYKQLEDILEDTSTDMDEYFYPDGPVISYGYDLLGTICVGIYEEEDIDKETINKIIGFIDSDATKKGINDVPIIFISEPMAKLCSDRDDSWRPVIGGIQCVANSHAGTTSFAATRNGQNGIVIAGHMGQPGDRVYQPDSSSSIGTITVSSNGDNSDSAWVP
ncbi:hypothetical protein J2128_002101 [Methanomicrobium sp. W14]|uniref:hypothetical protein n=1 Tax=Methanomicrobium sp. W14 TaxID=2817839 RepID=UPI001AE1B767|nr:hypothetical protein [Methanomicrobium sp. W14]MBP2134135.1 hypothetical protein [Methanomicrobium sp. W14]